MKRKVILIALLSLFVSSCEMGEQTGSFSISTSENSQSPSETSQSIDEPSVSPSTSPSDNESMSASTPIDDTGKLIQLQYSGSGSNRYTTLQLFEDFKAARKAAGDRNTYSILYIEHDPDKVNSEILDWTVGPDVYEFASDKMRNFYEKGILSSVNAENATFVENNNSKIGKDLAIINGDYYAYPYTADNTYYVQYDTSFYSANDVKSIETMLDKAQAAGKKVGYNLKEAFWGGPAMFTFGADYNMTFDEYGDLTNITADFNSEKGVKAVKAIKKIVNHPAWQNAMEAPTPTNNLVACIAGTWDITAYKEALGDNYGCAAMPTVTVDGDTQHLGAFLGGKLLGVNSLKSKSWNGEVDIAQLNAAHELAKFLTNKESQLKRFDELGIVPCNNEALNEYRVSRDPNVNALIEQSIFAHAQTIVPENFWTSSVNLVEAIFNGFSTENEIKNILSTYNDNIINSK